VSQLHLVFRLDLLHRLIHMLHRYLLDRAHREFQQDLKIQLHLVTLAHLWYPGHLPLRTVQLPPVVRQFQVLQNFQVHH